MRSRMPDSPRFNSVKFFAARFRAAAFFLKLICRSKSKIRYFAFLVKLQRRPARDSGLHLGDVFNIHQIGPDRSGFDSPGLLVPEDIQRLTIEAAGLSIDELRIALCAFVTR